MIIERTTYRPKAGLFEAVLATRRRASQRRRELGLPGGTIFVGNSKAGAIVFWECGYADEGARQRDIAVRDNDNVFSEIRGAMIQLLEQFERTVLRADSDRQTSRLVPCDLSAHSLAPRLLRFSSNGETLVGYLFLPPGAGPFPAMITNHGSGLSQGNTDVSSPGIAAVLASAGIASFWPNRRGYGESPGIPWRQEVTDEFCTDA